MIKTVIRLMDNMVIVFDRRGQQIPKYQRKYEEVGEKILRDAPPDAVFTHALASGEFQIVSKEEW